MSLRGIWNSKSYSQVPCYSKCPSYAGNHRDKSCRRVTEDAQNGDQREEKCKRLTYKHSKEPARWCHLYHEYTSPLQNSEPDVLAFNAIEKCQQKKKNGDTKAGNPKQLLRGYKLARLPRSYLVMFRLVCRGKCCQKTKIFDLEKPEKQDD